MYSGDIQSSLRDLGSRVSVDPGLKSWAKVKRAYGALLTYPLAHAARILPCLANPSARTRRVFVPLPCTSIGRECGAYPHHCLAHLGRERGAYSYHCLAHPSRERRAYPHHCLAHLANAARIRTTTSHPSGANHAYPYLLYWMITPRLHRSPGGAPDISPGLQSWVRKDQYQSPGGAIEHA
jgi:hypothetical protein